MQIGEEGVQIACKIAYILNGRSLTQGSNENANYNLHKDKSLVALLLKLPRYNKNNTP